MKSSASKRPVVVSTAEWRSAVKRGAAPGIAKAAIIQRLARIPEDRVQLAEVAEGVGGYDQVADQTPVNKEIGQLPVVEIVVQFPCSGFLQHPLGEVYPDEPATGRGARRRTASGRRG